MELAERGFEVTVVEPAGWGGKARSVWVSGTGRGGRLDLPSEHGFRFFPGFYRSLPDTCAGSRPTAARKGWRGIYGRRRRCFPRARGGWVSGSRMCPWLRGLGLRWSFCVLSGWRRGQGADERGAAVLREPDACLHDEQ
ncbi:hypothetical protein ACFWNF_31915 [Streptomyces anulatus]|uniref:hypothetical protein n=1 Tax=Streptomyces anulatus TaxID=1892 RepID=UPI00365068E0